MQLLIATKNAGKVKELSELLAPLPVKLRSLSDFENIAEPEENAASFAANAALKARYYALETGLCALADDSGLEVAALDGAPGIFSARYAGSKASDAEKIAKLLGELAATGDEKRLAGFVCAVAVSDENGVIIHLAEGVCGGKIADVPRGANGFGYDPIFIPDGFSETFAELSGGEKRKISHRGRAMNKIIAFLRDFTAV